MMDVVSRTLSFDEAMLEAVAHHSSGRLKEAEEIYRAILAVQPMHPDANHNLGMLAIQMGYPAMGLPCLKSAVEANSGNGQHWVSYIDALIQSGQADIARQVLDEGRQRGVVGGEIEVLAERLQQPDPLETSDLLETFNAGRYQDAADLAQALTGKYPQSGFCWKGLGAALKQLGRSGDALQPMQKAVALLPDEAEPCNNLGVVLQDVGRLKEAEASFLQAIQLVPDYAEAHYNLGFTLHNLNRLDDAVASYRKAILFKPDYVDGFFNLGCVLQAQGRLDDAIASYRQAVLIAPGCAKAYVNLGNTLKDKGQLAEAAASYRQALLLVPDFAEAHSNLGGLLIAQGQLDEAIAACRQALVLRPDIAEAHSNLIFALDLTADLDTSTLQAERLRWDAAHSAALHGSTAFENSADPERRLRVGYVSADFRQHSAAISFGVMLTHFDSAMFDVFAYSNSATEDDQTRLFQQSVTHWRKIVGLTDVDVADLIRQDSIDILVDLSGHSCGNRLLVFARKPAPIQITAWGYAGGTGMKAMDVLFSDPVIVPPEEKVLYAEEVLYLPSVISAFFPLPFPAVNPLPAATANGVVFGSFNRLVKLSARTITIWVQILLALPTSRMILKTPEFDDADSRALIKGQFSQVGVDPSRITLLGGSPWPDHVAIFNQVDICLDPFPQSGGVTTLEGLMMGVPVVTLCGNTFVGRGSASILTTLGLTDWIAETPEQYVEIAIRKAQGLAELAELRQGLRARFASSCIGQTKAYVAEVEEIYRDLWRKSCLK